MGPARAAATLIAASAVAAMCGCGSSTHEGAGSATATAETTVETTTTETNPSSVRLVYSAGYVGGPRRAALIVYRLPDGQLARTRARMPWRSRVLHFESKSPISISVRVRSPLNRPLGCGAETDEPPYGREYTASNEAGRQCGVRATLGER